MQKLTPQKTVNNTLPTLTEVLNQVPCETCHNLNSFKCDPTTCTKLEDLAINLGEITYATAPPR